MGVGFILINRTKKQRLDFGYVGASKARELAGNPAAAAITTWYLLENPGDDILFVDDHSGEDTYQDFLEVTHKMIDSLVENKVLACDGKEQYSDDELNVYDLKLRNIWMDT